MADYHILAGDRYGNQYTVAYHIPVPNVNNEVGVNYRTALVEWLGGASVIASAVPFIDSAELTQLQAGELFEVSEAFYSNPSETLIQRRDRLDVRYSQLVTTTQTVLQRMLGYWGYSRDVA